MFLNGFNILILKKLKIKNNIILIYFKTKGNLTAFIILNTN
jgi:hypothetical protein